MSPGGDSIPTRSVDASYSPGLYAAVTQLAYGLALRIVENTNKKTSL
jgi:hypothetical protein